MNILKMPGFAVPVSGGAFPSHLHDRACRRKTGGAREWESRVEEYETLKRLVMESEDDIRKAEGGNKAAGTRARKMMQEIKEAAQAVRAKILDLRGPDEKE